MQTHHEHHACAELARQGTLGSIFYILIWLVILSVTPLIDEWQWFAVGSALLLALLGGIRLLLGQLYLRGFIFRRQRWLRAYCVTALGLGLTWGCITAFSFWYYMPGWTAYLIGFATCGITAGGTISVSSNRPLQVGYILVMMAPPAIVLLFKASPQSLVLAAFFVLNTLFLVAIGRQLNAQYWHLRQLSETDALTGVANRRRFDSALKDEIQRANRSGYPLTLVMLDIDHFKAYNDNYGHGRGDDCLSFVAHRIEQTLRRPQDLVARYGGEEFICILPSCSAEGARQIAQRIQTGIKALRIPHLFSPVGATLTVSMGVLTVTPTIHSDADELASKVDGLLYQSKKEGRNRITYLAL